MQKEEHTVFLAKSYYPKEAEKFFATSKKGDLMAMEVIGKKDNITYYQAYLLNLKLSAKTS